MSDVLPNVAWMGTVARQNLGKEGTLLLGTGNPFKETGMIEKEVYNLMSGKNMQGRL